MTSLRELPIGKTATIRSVGGEGALRQHFLDMGLIPKGDVTMVKYAPMGDPMELRIHSYELTLRLADAEKIEIENIRDEVKPYEGKAVHKKDITKAIPHPGLGEGGKYHEKENEHPLPDSELLTFALAGNQNCGKTTLFNQLTGSSQHVGNFPGVTVDRKDGMIRGRNNTLVTDLPGIYSMSPYSSEEIVTRNFVLDEHPKGIINIVDATNIERNLYLTMQLMELNIPLVLALNMMDEVRANGGTVMVNELEELLGVPVVPISAATMQGVRELPGLVYNRLKDIPPVPVFTPEYKKPEPKANDRAYTIQRMEAHVWSIDAPWLEYILAGSNVDDYESLQYFQRQLDESGILTELVEKGVQENDTILIGEYQFDYIF